MSITRRKFIIGAGSSAIALPGIANLVSESPGLETHLDRGESLWIKSLPSAPRFESYSGTDKADLVVVGGGYTGLACAFYAKKFKPDWKVVVLEAQKIGSGSSSRNSGVVYAKYTGMDDKGFAERGLDRFKQFIDEQDINCDFQTASTLFMHHTKNSAEKAKNNIELGSSWINAQQLSDLTGTSYYAGAVDSPDYYKIDPAKLLLGKMNAALSVGVEIFENSTVTNIEHGQLANVFTKNGEVTAKNVLIATNGYTPRLGLLHYKMYPLHQFTLATRILSNAEIGRLGLHNFDLRFEPRILPVTFSLSPSGNFFYADGAWL